MLVCIVNPCVVRIQLALFAVLVKCNRLQKKKKNANQGYGEINSFPKKQINFFMRFSKQLKNYWGQGYFFFQSAINEHWKNTNLSLNDPFSLTYRYHYLHCRKFHFRSLLLSINRLGLIYCLFEGRESTKIINYFF